MHAHARRGALLGCLMFAGVLSGAGPAAAAEVRIDFSPPHESLYYEAGAGESNDVTYSDDGDKITVTDRGVAAILPSTASTDDTQRALLECTFVLNTVTCPAYQFATFNLGDGDDSLTTAALAEHYGAVPTVNAGPGNDHGSGSMLFYGGPGADDLQPGFGGAPTFAYAPGEAGDLTVGLDGVADDGHPGEGDNVRPGDNLWIRASGNHVLTGSDGPETLHLNFDVTGTSRIDGRGGDDWIDGGAGDDTIDGGAGVDHVYGGGGNDTIETRDGARDGAISCGDGTDTLSADLLDLDVLSYPDCESVTTG